MNQHILRKQIQNCCENAVQKVEILHDGVLTTSISPQGWTLKTSIERNDVGGFYLTLSHGETVITLYPWEVEKVVVTICEESCIVGPETWNRYELRVVMRNKKEGSLS